eukprot:Partr_v1_DN26289_c1_g1_i2_m47997 putative RNA binding motif protein
MLLFALTLCCRELIQIFVQIQTLLDAQAIPIRDFLLVRDKRTGESKGFVFVNFTTMQDSRMFMDRNYPCISVHGEFCKVNYVRESDHDDWMCSQCNGYNFKGRDECYRCSAAKPDKPVSQANDGSLDVSEEPFSMVVILGLDTLTTEQKFFESLGVLSSPESVMIMRDKTTKFSCGFGFALFASAEEASILINLASLYPDFTIDSAVVRFHYANKLCFLDAKSVDSNALIYWDRNITYSSFRPKRKEEILEDDLADFYAQLGGGDNSAKDDEFYSEESVSDWDDEAYLDGLTCTLCSMTFISDTDLNTHCKMSKEHGDNLETYRACMRAESLTFNRDLSAEELHESNNEPSTTSLNIVMSKKSQKKRSRSDRDKRSQREQGFLTAAEARELMSTKQTITAAPKVGGIGEKMLQKMGWKDGQGLGKSGTGITEPIDAETYGNGGGIGTTGKRTATELSMPEDAQRRLQARRRYDTFETSNNG